jgi:hypothetical protein
MLPEYQALEDALLTYDSAFALAHGPDDDGDEMPKAAPKAT